MADEKILATQDVRMALWLSGYLASLDGGWNEDVQIAFLDYASDELPDGVASASPLNAGALVKIKPEKLGTRLASIARLSREEATLIDLALTVEYMHRIAPNVVPSANASIIAHAKYERWLDTAEMTQDRLAERLNADRNLFLAVADAMRAGPDQLRELLEAPIAGSRSAGNGLSGLGALGALPVIAWIALAAAVTAIAGAFAITLTIDDKRVMAVAREKTRQLEILTTGVKEGYYTAQMVREYIASGALTGDPTGGGGDKGPFDGLGTWLTVGGVVVVGGLALWAFQFLPKGASTAKASA